MGCVVDNKALREKYLDAIFDNLDAISQHPQCEAIIRFMVSDLHDFCDYDKVIDELTNEELEDYKDDLDNPRINENNYDSIWESCRYLAYEKIQVSDFDINGNYLIWVD